MKIGKIDDKIIYISVKSKKNVKTSHVNYFVDLLRRLMFDMNYFKIQLNESFFSFNSNLIYLIITFFFFNKKQPQNIFFKKKTLAFKIKIHSLKRYENALSFYLDKKGINYT